ncbi:MAG: transcription antitermination factor NusB [Actinomycetota bacterium]
MSRLTDVDDPRSVAREAALSLLYEAETKSIPPRTVLDAQVVPADVDVAVLVGGVQDHADRIDALIDAHADGWTIDRMASLDRNVLRIATFELIGRPEVPTAVILDEAVELAKRFGTDDSGRFVNGVMSAIARATR